MSLTGVLQQFKDHPLKTHPIYSKLKRRISSDLVDIMIRWVESGKCGIVNEPEKLNSINLIVYYLLSK